MVASPKVEVTADPQLLARYVALQAKVAAAKTRQRSRWYCDRPGCDGEPHEGWHFCDHPLPHPAGEEFWRCRHARAAQHPPAGDWLVWLILAGRGWGKLLSVDTPLPTPTGWTTMGDVRPGDLLLDEAGRPTKILWASDVQWQDSWRVTFTDGSSLIAHGEHEWVTWTHAERKALLRSPYEAHDRFPQDWPAWRSRRLVGHRDLRRDQVEPALALYAQGLSARAVAAQVGLCRQSLAPHLRAGRYVERAPRVYDDSPGPQVRTTDEIRRTLTIGARQDRNHAIPTCLPLQLPDADLPIDPYVLGVWLGDGSSAAAAITIADVDAPYLLAALAAAGTPATGNPRRKQDGRCATYPIGGRPARRGPAGTMMPNGSLHSALRSAGVLKNKHVPGAYLRGSQAQRLALLQGLMDTDGGVESGSYVSFTNTNERLSDAVYELAMSLGMTARRDKRPAMLNGIEHGTAHRVSFTPTMQVFRLPRKASRLRFDGPQSLRHHHRMIASVERIPTVPMRCITVDSPHSLYLAGESMIPTHNSRTGAEWLVHNALRRPKSTWAVVAPTRDDLRDTCIEGESGLLNVLDMPRGSDEYDKSNLRIRLPNGALIRGLTAERPERTRGPNLAGIWGDELAIWRYPHIWDDLTPALRRGKAQAVVTTTPKPTPLVRMLAEQDNTHVTYGSTFDNASNLTRTVLTDLQRRWEGTRQARQELYGELLTDTPGALWTVESIEVGRARFVAA